MSKKREKHKKRLNAPDFEKLKNEIAPDLQVVDFKEWQTACKAFGPVHYNTETRIEWFEKNRSRLDAAKEMVDFLDTRTETLSKDDDFSGYTTSAIRDGIVLVIRNQQERRRMKLGKLNAVKLAGFRTLIKWADDQTELEKGPYKGAAKIPEGAEKRPPRKSKKSRKGSKGKYRPPNVQLVEDYFLVNDNRILLSISIENSILHPYQNIVLELDIDERLSVVGVKPYPWSPRTNRIPVGFLAASLDDSVSKLTVDVSLHILDPAPEYTIGGLVHYDDTDKGKVASFGLETTSIKLQSDLL
ncbi:MAG: hypothetical protein ACW98Y_11370 [Candidatus Thorarchaeota archaeon]|jgi:hypothetical protein